MEKKQLLWLIIFIATIAILAICFNDTNNSTKSIDLDVSSILNTPLFDKGNNKVTTNIIIVEDNEIDNQNRKIVTSSKITLFEGM